MEKFRGVDYYGLEALLVDEERMVRDAVRDWVEAEFLPVVGRHHREGTLVFPPLCCCRTRPRYPHWLC